MTRRNQDALKKHPKDRAFERFSITLSKQDLRQAVNSIKRGTAHHVERLSHTRNVYLIKVKGIKVKIVYSSTTHKIVTIFDKDSLGHPDEKSVRTAIKKTLREM